MGRRRFFPWGVVLGENIPNDQPLGDKTIGIAHENAYG